VGTDSVANRLVVDIETGAADTGADTDRVVLVLGGNVTTGAGGTTTEDIPPVVSFIGRECD
jgi:hypothetical protein